MGVSVETKAKEKNLSEMISEARVKQLMEEEQVLEQTDTEVQKIRLETLELISFMEMARAKDDEALRRKFRNDIVVLNLRLVTQVLKKYGSFSPDKFQNGCIGLLKAAEMYNSEKGVPFGNFACFCIETEIRLAFKKVNRMFESKAKGFLDSFDAPTGSEDSGDKATDKHDMVEDPYSAQEFDSIIEEAEIDFWFYDIIMPCIEAYGTRSKDIDMTLWKELELQYFLELSMENSQRQRITFTEMAKRLGTKPQNLRVRHQKVTQLIKAKCEELGLVTTGSKQPARKKYTWKNKENKEG